MNILSLSLHENSRFAFFNGKILSLAGEETFLVFIRSCISTKEMLLSCFIISSIINGRKIFECSFISTVSLFRQRTEFLQDGQNQTIFV